MSNIDNKIENQGASEFVNQSSLVQGEEWIPVEWAQAQELMKQGLKALDPMKVVPKFSINNNDKYIYVDKTGEILTLLDYDNVFLARPRRMGKTTTVETLIEMGKSAYLESIDPNYTLPTVFQNTAFEMATPKQKQAIAAPFIVHLDFMSIIPWDYEYVIDRQANIEQLQEALAIAETNKQEQLDALNNQEQEAIATAEANKQEQIDNIANDMEQELSSLKEMQIMELNSLKNNQSETKNKLDQLNQKSLDESIQDRSGKFNEIILKWTESQLALDSVFQQQINALIDTHVNQINLIKQKYLAQVSALDSKYSSKIDAIKQNYTTKRGVVETEFSSKINAIKREHATKMKELESKFSSKPNIINQGNSTQESTLDQVRIAIKSKLIQEFNKRLKNAVAFNLKTARDLNLPDLELKSSEILAHLESFNYDASNLSISDNVFDLLSQIPNDSIMLVIDEYDAVIALTLKCPSLCINIMSIFREFFATLKECHNKFKFSFITGITSYQKVSLFSEGNQIHDISFDTKFSSITGFTEDELKNYFAPAICRLAVITNSTPQKILELLRSFYDGYCFANPGSVSIKNNQLVGSERIFNPISVQKFLMQDSTEFESYWIETGGALTSTIRSLLGFAFSAKEFTEMLLKAKDGSIIVHNKEELTFLTIDISRESLRASLPIFLLQAGYLSIDYSKTTSTNIVLSIPNKEVEHYLLEEELDLFGVKHLNLAQNINRILTNKQLLDCAVLDCLFCGNAEVIQCQLYEFFMNAVSYQARDSLNESGWRDVLYNVLNNISQIDSVSKVIKIEREKIELAGRSDLMITDEDQKHRVVLEFKLVQSIKTPSVKTETAIDLALSQIQQRDYGVDHRYKLDRYACVLNLIYKPRSHDFDKLQVAVEKLPNLETNN